MFCKIGGAHQPLRSHRTLNGASAARFDLALPFPSVRTEPDGVDVRELLDRIGDEAQDRTSVVIVPIASSSARAAALVGWAF